MVGDLKNGRTVHSLARLLSLYQVQLQYISPPGLGMPKHVMEYVARKGIPQKVYERLEDVLADTHVLYMTRIQRERFQTQEEYEKVILKCFAYSYSPKLNNFLFSFKIITAMDQIKHLLKYICINNLKLFLIVTLTKRPHCHIFEFDNKIFLNY